MREKVYDKRGIRMTKDARAAASARIPPEEQRLSILERRPAGVKVETAGQ